MQKIPQQTIGDLIRKHRVAKRYSQRALAELLGISQNALHKLENNEVQAKLDLIVQLALIMELSVYEFIPENQRKKLPPPPL